MSDGSHTITFWSVDNAGNVEATHTVTFTEDTVAPSTTLTTSPAAPDGSNSWFKEAVGVTLTATDTGGTGVASTSYTVDGGSTQTYSGPFAISTAGTHTVTYWSTDNAGNVESTHSATIKIDLAAPVSSAAVTPAPQNGWYASPTVTLSATDDASGVVNIRFSIDGAAGSQIYSSPITNFSTGDHFVTFWATDNAGRVEASHMVAFKADSTKPSVSIITPGDGSVIPQDKVAEAEVQVQRRRLRHRLLRGIGGERHERGRASTRRRSERTRRA